MEEKIILRLHYIHREYVDIQVDDPDRCNILDIYIDLLEGAEKKGMLFPEEPTLWYVYNFQNIKVDNDVDLIKMFSLLHNKKLIHLSIEPDEATCKNLELARLLIESKKCICGVAHLIIRASGYNIDAIYLESYEDELLVMCQVESIDVVGRIEDIVVVKGIECIQMGTMDLSASMGYMWDPRHKKVKKVLRGLEKAVLNTSSQPGKDAADGAYLVGFAISLDALEGMKSCGYHMISGVVDIGLFRSAVVEDVKKFKLSLTIESFSDEEEKEDEKEGYWSE